MKLNINTKLVIFCTLIVAIPGIILGMVGYNAAEKAVNGGLGERLKDQSNQIAHDAKVIYNISQNKIKSQLSLAHEVFYGYGLPSLDSDGNLFLDDDKKEELIQQKVNADLVVAHTIFHSKGNAILDKGEMLTFEAVNQISKEKTIVSIPAMKLGGKKLALNYDLVDQIKTDSGVETATIFQLIPEGLLRISTNVMSLDGTRAVGTYIPKESPVYQATIKKETYKGTAFVVNAWYRTAYEPILDDKGNMIGVLYVGAKQSKHILNNNFEIVDKVKSLVGGTATVFQLKKFEGQKENDATTKDWTAEKAMYRISTNVMKTDGERAVGTILSKPVYEKIMQGESYYGRAFVVNAWYQTAYEPIKDSKTNEIVGVLYVGVKESDFQEEMLSNLATQVIGETGYVFIYNQKGDYVLSKKRERDGQNTLSQGTVEEKKVVQDFINKALALKAEEATVTSYQWKNTGESSSRNKLAGLSYMKEWDWIIGASSYTDENFGGTGGLKQVKNIIFLVALVSLILAIILGFLFANRISSPIRKLTKAGNKIAEGDIETELPDIKSGDEIEDLGITMNLLVGALKYLKKEAKK